MIGDALGEVAPCGEHGRVGRVLHHAPLREPVCPVDRDGRGEQRERHTDRDEDECLTLVVAREGAHGCASIVVVALVAPGKNRPITTALPAIG